MNQGSIEAKYLLSQNLINGFGIAKDFEAGMCLLTEAAAAGHPQATYQMAVFYKIGRGVPKDEKKANALLEVAANNVSNTPCLVSPNCVGPGVNGGVGCDEWTALHAREEHALSGRLGRY